MNFGSDSQYEKEIEQRKRLHRLRTLSPVEQNGSRTRIVYKEQSCVNFCSNDYLGLATHPHVLQRASEWTFALGAGSSASRLISGTTNEHIALEERIAHFTGWEAALLFGSGYLANATLIPALVGREDGILVDRMAHNSILHGCKASNGRFRRFRHNNMNHLEDLIRNSVETFRTTWVITETLFSMDGDESPLEDLVSLCKKYGVRLYLDDAHSFGVMGDQGKGLGAETVGADLVLATLGKAAGGYGAFALLSETLREYLINRCGGFIYTTSLPPSILGAADAALDLIPAMNRERCKLFEFATLFREAVLKAGGRIPEGKSQIVPVLATGENRAMEWSEQLLKQGLFVQAIRPPTVRESRLRVTFSAAHTSLETDHLIQETSKLIRNTTNDL